MKVNCWEHRDCGREPGGHSADELGVCPAAECVEAHGVNGGINGGRVCWAIASTLCGTNRQDELRAKLRECANCDFMQMVHAEEPHTELWLA